MTTPKKTRINLTKDNQPDQNHPGNSEISPNTKVHEERFENMSNDIFEICKILSEKWGDNSENKSTEIIHRIQSYIEKYNRILYSSISNYIFGLYGDGVSIDVRDEKIGNMQTNSSFLANYVYQQKSTHNNPKQLDLLPVCEKLMDHISLACQQCNSLKQTDEEYQKKFEEQITPFKQEVMKDIHSQLLTIIGIFTALAFLLFGGISSLENIFSNIQQTSILKLVILGCIWGLCLVNLIFVFLFCVSKMTKLSFTSTDQENASIYQKYPIFWWTNYIILCILLLSSILYYLKTEKMLKWLNTICSINPAFICFVLLSMAIIIIVYIGFKLKKSCDKNPTDMI